jgi:triosephosphate isomerase
MRKKIIAANWKMNKNLTETNNFITFLIEKMPETEAEIIIAPAFTNLYHAYETSRDEKIEIVAQNMHQEEEGAYTGEISADMLKSVGVTRVILGHSERRQYFNENDELLAAKVKTALANDMQVTFCIGERLKDRKKDDHFEVVRNQLTNGLPHLVK